MSAETVVESIAHLDFTPALPCEHSQHDILHADEPATWITQFSCDACPYTSKYLICESGRVRLMTSIFRCRGCRLACTYLDGTLMFTPLVSS